MFANHRVVTPIWDSKFFGQSFDTPATAGGRRCWTNRAFAQIVIAQRSSAMTSDNCSPVGIDVPERHIRTRGTDGDEDTALPVFPLRPCHLTSKTGVSRIPRTLGRRQDYVHNCDTKRHEAYDNTGGSVAHPADRKRFAGLCPGVPTSAVPSYPSQPILLRTVFSIACSRAPKFSSISEHRSYIRSSAPKLFITRF